MKHKTRAALAVGILSILLCISSCRKESTLWRGSITEKDGVIVVSNPADPMFGQEACSIEEELSVGSPESGSGHVFSEMTDLAVDAEGKIYLLDSREACVVVFNETGDFERAVGKRGQGPGEMQRPISISIAPANEILVNDRGARALHFFGLSGEHKRSLPLARTPSFSRPKADSRNSIIARSLTIGPTHASFVLAKFDSEVNELFEVFSRAGGLRREDL